MSITCMICLEYTVENDRKLDCGHVFHKDCLKNWEENNSCPICRQSIDNNRPVKKCRYTSPEEDREIAIDFARNIAGDDYNGNDMMQAIINSISYGEFEHYNLSCADCDNCPCICSQEDEEEEENEVEEEEETDSDDD